uniref:KIB1-4 beta-propeller domain-containing protein n=1 Tax=Aegilops tauschii TaxID=37682 RepID=M8B703_AEGTA
MAKDSSWAYLPDDLRRLASLADRVRAAAICRPWGSAAGKLPPTRLPWVLFANGTLFDLGNDSVPHPHHRLRLPDDCWRYSAGENMMFLVHQRDGSCSLLNALSGATTRLPELAGPNRAPMKAIGKVVVSSSADGDPIIVAVLIGRDVIVSTCRPVGESNSFLLGALHHEAIDIALFQGKIYALSRGHVLETLDLSNGHQKGFKLNYSTELMIKHPWQNYHHQDFQDGFPLVKIYLAESGGKLLMVKRWLRCPWMRTASSPDAASRRTFRFEVWEADLSERRWKKLDGCLEGQALFVSRPCSKSLPAGHGVRGDSIYFLNKLYQWKQPEAPLGDSGVYKIRDKTFIPLLRDSMPSLPWKSERFPSWFFPVQF